MTYARQLQMNVPFVDMYLMQVVNAIILIGQFTNSEGTSNDIDSHYSLVPCTYPIHFQDSAIPFHFSSPTCAYF